MENYTREGLETKDREKKKKEGIDEDEDEIPKEKKSKYPKKYYNYKLTGIVIHMGTADSGHYYSLITDRENPDNKNNWYQFILANFL